MRQIFIGFKEAYDSVRIEVLYNILNECGTPMKLTRLIKMCLNETCSRVRVGMNLSDMFSIRNGLQQRDVLLPLIFDIALEYTIRRVQVDQDGLLNGTRQLLVYADGINIMDGNVQTIKKNPEALLIGSKKIGLDVNADKTKHMVMTGYQNAGRSHSTKIDNTSFERVEEFKYLGTALTNQNSIQEEIKRKLKSGNACYHLVQNLLSSTLLSNNLNIKIYRTIILPVVYGCETLSLTLREERRLRVFENRVLRRIFGPKRDKITGKWENYIMRSLMICTPHPLLFG